MTKILMAALLLSFASVPAMAAPNDAASTAAKNEAKARIDTDSDGFVSKAEFMAAQEKRFAETDANGDGKISDEEHRASYQKWRDRRSAMREKTKADVPTGAESADAAQEADDAKAE